jgi:phenylalanyl-tRNA synthetase beta chain
LAAFGIATSLDGDIVVATVPDYRQDYLHPVDVVEDYAISRGYEQIQPLLPADFTIGALHPLTEFEDRLRDLMIGFAFEELFCNILTNAATIRRRMDVDEASMPTTPAFHGGPAVHIANVMNRNYSHLRDWVLPSLLEVEAQSTGALYPHRVFEVGEVAVLDPTHELGARSASRLAALIAADDATFDGIQSVLYALFAYLGIAFDIHPWRHPSFIAGRAGLIMARPDQAGAAVPVPAGFLGELSPQVLTHWGARTPAAAFELSVELLPALGSNRPG